MFPHEGVVLFVVDSKVETKGGREDQFRHVAENRRKYHNIIAISQILIHENASQTTTSEPFTFKSPDVLI